MKSRFSGTNLSAVILEDKHINKLSDLKMITKVKKGMQKKEIDSLLEKHKNSKKRKIDLKKYCGTIQLIEDPLVTQKQMRNEWK